MRCPLTLLVCLLPAILFATELGERRISPAQTFSFCAPNGWTVKMDEETESVTADYTSGSLTATERKFSEPLDRAVSTVVARFAQELPNFKKLSTKPFRTKRGLEGVQVVTQHVADAATRPARQTLYFFKGRPGHVVYFVCTVLDDLQGPELQSVFDDSVSTLQILD